MTQDWLEKSSRFEKPILETSGAQVRQVIDDLLPQIRLAERTYEYTVGI